MLKWRNYESEAKKKERQAHRNRGQSKLKLKFILALKYKLRDIFPDIPQHKSKTKNKNKKNLKTSSETYSRMRPTLRIPFVQLEFKLHNRVKNQVMEWHFINASTPKVSKNHNRHLFFFDILKI